MTRPTDLHRARHVIANSLAEYCAAVDVRDAAQVNRALRGAALTFRGQEVAPSEVEAFYAAAFASTTETATVHVFDNLHVRAASDDTRETDLDYRASYQRWEVDDTGPPRCVALGTYTGSFTTPRDADRHDPHTADLAWVTHSVATLATPPNRQRSTT